MRTQKERGRETQSKLESSEEQLDKKSKEVQLRQSTIQSLEQQSGTTWQKNQTSPGVGQTVPHIQIELKLIL